MRGDSRRVVVFSRQVSDHFRVFAVVVTEPKEIVDALRGGGAS